MHGVIIFHFTMCHHSMVIWHQDSFTVLLSGRFCTLREAQILIFCKTYNLTQLISRFTCPSLKKYKCSK